MRMSSTTCCKSFVALPDDSSAAGVATKPIAIWAEHFATLAATGRTIHAQSGARSYWLAAEKTKSFTAIFPDATFDSQAPDIEPRQPSREDALFASITGWLAHLGPITIPALADFLGIAASDVEKTMLRMEAAGSILRGQFTDSSSGETEWCDRRLLARIHRLTLGTLRKQIQPVSAAQFMRWLLRWQHVTPETRLLGERGTLEALQQLQGFEAPANAWEQQILARRVANYDPNVLDRSVSHRSGRLGAPLPASRDLRRAQRNQSSRRSHQRCAAHVFHSRRRGLDDLAPHFRRSSRRQGRLHWPEPCCSRSASAPAPARRIVFRGYRARNWKNKGGAGNSVVGAGNRRA